MNHVMEQNIKTWQISIPLDRLEVAHQSSVLHSMISSTGKSDVASPFLKDPDFLLLAKKKSYVLYWLACVWTGTVEWCPSDSSTLQDRDQNCHTCIRVKIWQSLGVDTIGMCQNGMLVMGLIRCSRTSWWSSLLDYIQSFLTTDGVYPLLYLCF